MGNAICCFSSKKGNHIKNSDINVNENNKNENKFNIENDSKSPATNQYKVYNKNEAEYFENPLPGIIVIKPKKAG